MTGITGIDIGILVVIGISALVSFVRGFFTEAVSLATWLAALVISTRYAHQFGGLFRQQIENDLARGVVSWLALFMGTLLIGGLINFLFGKLRSTVKLGLFDRVIGLGFGVARGILFAGVIVMAAHLDFFTSLREGALWNTSTLLPYILELAKFMHSFLPEREGSYFDFNGDIV